MRELNKQGDYLYENIGWAAMGEITLADRNCEDRLDSASDYIAQKTRDVSIRHCAATGNKRPPRRDRTFGADHMDKQSDKTCEVSCVLYALRLANEGSMRTPSCARLQLLSDYFGEIMRCISCSYELNNPVKVRDNYFPADHELALMTVCYPCAVEYVETYKRIMDKNAPGAVNEAYDRECYETSNANVLANEEYRMAEFLALDDMEDTMHHDPSLFFSHPTAVEPCIKVRCDIYPQFSHLTRC